MQFVSAHTRQFDHQHLRKLLSDLADQLANGVDLGILFFSLQIADVISELSPDLPALLGTENLIGCSSDSVIADQFEIEFQPALSIWLASLPGVDVQTCHLEFKAIGNDAVFTGWSESLMRDWPSDSTVIALADPFSFPMDVFLDRINEDHTGIPVVGGMCCGSAVPGESRLLLGSEIHDSGCVILNLSGNVLIHSLVSQGCRPVGTPLVITRAVRNEVHELGGMAALDQIKRIFDELPTREKQLVNSGLHFGRVINEYQDRFEHGDFLIRNVLQVDQESGAIVVADFVKPGQTIQFQVRDHETAHADLLEMLRRVGGAGHSANGQPFEAALLFSCNGRGTNLFPVEHHDAGLVREELGDIPVAGFFAAGEVGPVGGRNFLHGFTASIALFQSK